MRRTKQCCPPAKRFARHERLFARRAKLRNLARRAQSSTLRVAPPRVQRKKPCVPRCGALPAKHFGGREGPSGLRAELPGLLDKQTAWRESARARLGSVNGGRYSADDTNTNKQGWGMGACAWVVGRCRRRLRRDGWVAAGAKTTLVQGAGVTDFSGRHKAGETGSASLENPGQSNIYNHVRILVRVDWTDMRQFDQPLKLQSGAPKMPAFQN